MPVDVKKVGGKFRVIEGNTGRISTSSGGKPKDGGGHDKAQSAGFQVSKINEGVARKQTRGSGIDRIPSS